jgi:2'-5' RNA ligase
MRTFIAIPIPDSCREFLSQMQLHLKRSDAEVRWTAIPSIHLTLKFLGETDLETVSELSRALRAVAHPAQVLNLQLSGLGCFPNQRKPRIVWCGIRGDIEQLEILQETVERTCMGFGFEPEIRPFRPHLTLGRVKGKKNLQTLVDNIMEGSDLESGFCTDHFNIYNSVLKPRGAVYTILETIELKQSRRILLDHAK